MSTPNPLGHTVLQLRDIASDMRKAQANGTFPDNLAQLDPDRIEWLCDDHASLVEQVAKLRGALQGISTQYEKLMRQLDADDDDVSEDDFLAQARAVLAETQP